MFLDQRMKNSLMVKLDILDEITGKDAPLNDYDRVAIRRHVSEIRKMLTDQPLTPTATPE